MYGFLRVAKFLHDIKIWNNNQYNKDKIFVKSTLWSSPYKVPFSVVLTKKTWNLVSV